MPDADRVFPIVSDPNYFFYAGVLPEGRQALVGRSVYGEIAVAVFDSAGNFLELQEQTLPADLARDLPTGDEADERKFRSYLKGQFGFTPALIRIKEFHAPRELLAVYHLPKHLQEFLTDPNAPLFSDEDRKDLPASIEGWLAADQFVLEWGNDYWLDRNGEVVAS